MRGPFRLGGFDLYSLRGGEFRLDGGALFGVVPKGMWSRKYPTDEDNRVRLVADPILVRTPDGLVLIETGLGDKLTDKQKDIYGVLSGWDVPGELASLDISPGDIDHVVLTHYDFDHAGGVVTSKDGVPRLAFPNAGHFIQRSEWEDALNPNRRSAHTYWPVNNEALRGSAKLRLVEGDAEVVPGVRLVSTGGHSRGHQIVVIDSMGQKALHMADLLPTHAHFNPLWITAYDNFPLDSIAQKEKWEGWGISEGAWFTFYHDPHYFACRYDHPGEITEEWR